MLVQSGRRSKFSQSVSLSVSLSGTFRSCTAARQSVSSFLSCLGILRDSTNLVLVVCPRLPMSLFKAIERCKSLRERLKNSKSLHSRDKAEKSHIVDENDCLRHGMIGDIMIIIYFSAALLCCCFSLSLCFIYLFENKSIIIRPTVFTLRFLKRVTYDFSIDKS